jgi:hypothetical protein
LADGEESILRSLYIVKPKDAAAPNRAEGLS